ncbi:hypothetical protein WN51_03287 [Melipona quadrifasciata]|uniref:Uncharacterized protein n=1 Tax=Melipona quadrifasciata TaxID=166423 RepID=A0A0M8ZTK1_9HYME|nr:hypothetical protein WN51_03287 [Melipona quadrifasciata]
MDPEGWKGGRAAGLPEWMVPERCDWKVFWSRTGHLETDTQARFLEYATLPRSSRCRGILLSKGLLSYPERQRQHLERFFKGKIGKQGFLVDAKKSQRHIRPYKSVSEFPIGAISIEDFKPIEEKIRTTRESLRRLNAKLLTLKSQYDFYATNEKPEGKIKDTVTDLHEVTANSLINNAVIKLCLHSYTIQAILEGKESDNDTLNKLFTLNDNILLLQNEIEDALKVQLQLKIQCRNALFEYKSFLKEQEEIRDKKLEEINPELVKNKEKTNKTITSINIMKKLIVNFIAASNHMLFKEPFLVKMLEAHRELISIETVSKMSQNNSENEEDKS